MCHAVVCLFQFAGYIFIKMVVFYIQLSDITLDLETINNVSVHPD